MKRLPGCAPTEYPITLHRNCHLDDGSQRYLFNGKEYDDMHGIGLLYYGARYYDPATARWLGVDSRMDDTPWLGGHVFCHDNPFSNFDPDGNSPWKLIGKAALRIGKSVVKHGFKALSQASTYADAFSETVDGISTLADKNASTTDKVLAGLSLASEALPVSISDCKDLVKAGEELLKGSEKVRKIASGAKKVVSGRPKYKSRPKYAKGQVEAVWNSHKSTDGCVFDSNTEKKLEWDKSKRRGWNMGHIKGKEYRKLKL